MTVEVYTVKNIFWKLQIKGDYSKFFFLEVWARNDSNRREDARMDDVIRSSKITHTFVLSVEIRIETQILATLEAWLNDAQ